VMECFFQSFTPISDIPHSRYCRDMGEGREGESSGRSQRYIPKNALAQKRFVC
jgi:hypothetical protein